MGFPVTLFRKFPEADGQYDTGLQLYERRNAGRPTGTPNVKGGSEKSCKSFSICASSV